MSTPLSYDELLALDLIQRVREATVQILDTDVDVVTLTGRANENIFPATDGMALALPVIVFAFIVATELAADGDTRDPLIQFTAYAPAGRADLANALVAVVERKYTAAAFAALATPIDAFVTQRVRRNAGPSYTPGPNDPPPPARADLDVTLQVCQPSLLP